TIGANVIRFACGVDPWKGNVKRMHFSTVTLPDLRRAYENLEPFDAGQTEAGLTRHVLDWYYGINLSRALTSAMRIKRGKGTLSIGRVQGPALKLIVDREREIKAFVPMPYWELSIHLKGVEFMHTKGRFLDEAEADLSLERTAAKAVVKSVERKEQAIPPQPCFDLTSLQLEAYRVFRYSPSRTLELAQNLYEASLITYPRTSSQKIPPSINLSHIISDISKDPEYAPMAKKLMENSWYAPMQGKKEDPAHPAIHPTGLHARVDGAEKNLYDLIVRRFMAAFAPPARKERVRVEADAGGEPYAASGSRLVEKGWVEFYGKYYTTEDTELPVFAGGEILDVKDKKKARKETKPPKRYTEASLVAELEERHLGTKATRSVIVETLFKRGYVSGKSMEVSDFGLKVCEVLQKYAPEILDENLTRKLEDEMEGIQEGRIDKDRVIQDGKEILVQILDKWKKNEARIGADLLEALKATEAQQVLVGQCDKCGKQLRIIRMKLGRQFIGCSGYPECRNAYPLPTGASVSVTGKACPDCGKPTVNVKKARMRFTMCIDPNCPSKEKWNKGGSNEKDSRASGPGQGRPGPRRP
ncbi:MAG: DNA topoisomerase I, partial [Candidatus Aenigmatarchaeota archaeon]